MRRVIESWLTMRLLRFHNAARDRFPDSPVGRLFHPLKCCHGNQNDPDNIDQSDSHS